MTQDTIKQTLKNTNIINPPHSIRKKLRLCFKCCEPLSPKETKIHCEKCRLIIKQDYQAKKENCKQLRICFICGTRLDSIEYFKCHKCYEKARMNQKPYNDKIDRKSKAPKLCLGGCGVLVDQFGKYCPECKKESIKRNTKNSYDKSFYKNNNQQSKPITERKSYQGKTLTEKEKQISTKQFFLQLEIDQTIKTGNYMGFNIKRVRKLKKISTSNFINKTGLKIDEIYNIEKGKKEINLQQFKEIVITLGVDSSMFEIEADKLCKKLYSKFNTEIVNIDFIIKGEYRI